MFNKKVTGGTDDLLLAVARAPSCRLRRGGKNLLV
jgi:hypothetical protein